MTASLKKLLLRIVGVVFIVLGIVGLFLPILQGFLLLVIGASLVFYDSAWYQALLERLEKRYPEKVGKLRGWMEPREESE